MHHKFSDFLRHGGNAQYVFERRNGRVFGRQSILSIKSSFPNYAALRADFNARLEVVIAENTRMLLRALTPPDTVPRVTETDLRDVSDAKDEVLTEWDARLERIFAEYQTHPQRLRPLRTAMEERLLRAFAGAINQLRQEELGVEVYIWRSQDDAKVRDLHAGYDDRLFRWDSPPEGGHPGEAYNCRCYAEPIPPGAQGDALLADFAPTADSMPNGNSVARRVGNGLLARSPAGLAAYAALEAGNQLQAFTRAASERRVQDAAQIMGVDLATVEGRLAALAYARARQFAEDGVWTGTPERGNRARVIAEALSLYEMYRPGHLTLPDSDAADDFAQTGRRLAAQALAALDAGRLEPEDGALSRGWVEVFPELTDDERRLGQLPGFTPERIEQWLETFPFEDLGLPTTTGTPRPDDPTDDVISTPIPEEVGPNIVEARPGTTETPAGNIILPHGDKGDGLEYITSKGHTVEQIDEIIANPNRELSGFVKGFGPLKRQDVQLLFGADGHWVKLDENGYVFAASNRNLGLSHDENDSGEIIRPLEEQ